MEEQSMDTGFGTAVGSRKPGVVMWWCRHGQTAVKRIWKGWNGEEENKRRMC